ncbi:MAG: hypothetical protein OXE87_12120, partial [Chloroflexi bacterium]|nr:hypothetical protein [Chloroflexota bacterium]
MADSQRLDGKVALITGGGRGMGQGPAPAYAAAGAAWADARAAAGDEGDLPVESLRVCHRSSPVGRIITLGGDTIRLHTT